ncbi:cupin domain protein [Xylaria flabelliformis]|nr:cupin domain protein [Xylaria flabelliformis]
MTSGESHDSPSINVPNLPNPTRVITTTNLENGISSFDNSFDESVGPVQNLNGALFRLAYTSGQAPQVLDGSDLDIYGGHLKNVPPLVVPGGGANVWYIDTPPGGESPLHRTISLDFVVIVEGEVQLTLDSGETRTLKPGDMIVQRGTTHKWTNLSKNKWSRMIGIMAASQPITLNDGTKLGVSGLG